MQPRPHQAITAAERRRRAEERLHGQNPEMALARTEADTQRLVHELQVHQIELELQNLELQQARDIAEAAREKYSELYDFAPIGYLTFDRAGTIREANFAAASLLGFARSRLPQPFGPQLSQDDRPAFDAFLGRVFAGKAKDSCEVKLLREGQPAFVARIVASAAPSGQECRAVIADITGRKLAEEERLVLSKLESTGILAGGIAHDFNNLLTVILLNLELAQTIIPPGGEELATLLEQAKQAGLTAKSLTQRLLTFAKGGVPVREPSHLAGVIQEFARLAASDSRLRCVFSLAEDLDMAEVDNGQIGQVIRNLVLNAQEAMPQGGEISIRAENVVLGPEAQPSLPPGDYIRVSIADQGVGMPKEMLSKIFDPYFSTKQKGDQRGMGLGLTICHAIIQKHGGAITVESEPGVGTTFHLHLPAYRKLLPKEEPSVPVSRPPRGKIRALAPRKRQRND